MWRAVVQSLGPAGPDHQLCNSMQEVPIRLTLDLKPPNALPLLSASVPSPSSSQHPAAAAVRPVTTVALVYASAAAAVYRIPVATRLSERNCSRGRMERRIRARMHDEIPYEASRISPFASFGRVCRACRNAERMPMTLTQSDIDYSGSKLTGE